MRTRKITSALAANSYSQIVSIVIQLLTFKLFLGIWSSDQLGRWLVMAAVPTFVLLFDFGFTPTLTNLAVLRMRQGDHKATQSVISALSTLSLVISAAALITGALALSTIKLLLPQLVDADEFIALSALICVAAISLLFGPIDAVLRAQDRFALSSGLGSTIRLAEWVGGYTALLCYGSFSSVALGMLVVRGLGTIGCAFVLSRNASLEMRPSLSRTVFELLRSALPDALRFLYFPIGNALTLQATLPIIAYFFGPSAVVAFSATRTVARLVTQVLTLVNRSLWAEFTHAFGNRDLHQIRLLATRGTQSCVLLAIIFWIVVSTLGASIFKYWIGPDAPIDNILLQLMLLSTAITATWQSRWVGLMATNSFHGFSEMYLLISFATVAGLAASSLTGILWTTAVIMVAQEISLAVLCHRYWHQLLEVKSFK